jgi:hypothetical protein
MLKKLPAYEESVGILARTKLAKPGPELTMIATLSSTPL